MTGRKGQTRKKRMPAARGTFPWAIASLVAVGLIGAGLVALAVFASNSEEPLPGGRANIADDAREPQVIAGLEVLAPWADHGEVPLDTPVGHEWLLRNSSTEALSLASARIEILEGC